MTPSLNLLGEPEPTLLPEDPAAQQLAEAEAGHRSFAEVAASHPTSSAVWAALARDALLEGSALNGDKLEQQIIAYAYARTGYHRGLDALRRAGWKGHGPVPWSHKPNQGFLRCLAALARAAGAIGETDEAARCTQFLTDCDPAAADELS